MSHAETDVAVAERPHDDLAVAKQDELRSALEAELAAEARSSDVEGASMFTDV